MLPVIMYMQVGPKNWHKFLYALTDFQNRLTFGKVKAYKNVPIFGPPCRPRPPASYSRDTQTHKHTHTHAHTHWYWPVVSVLDAEVVEKFLEQYQFWLGVFFSSVCAAVDSSHIAVDGRCIRITKCPNCTDAQVKQSLWLRQRSYRVNCYPSSWDLIGLVSTMQRAADTHTAPSVWWRGVVVASLV